MKQIDKRDVFMRGWYAGIITAAIICISVITHHQWYGDFGMNSLISRGIIEHNQQTGKLQWKESK
jgi:hypothetical protein